MLEEGSNYLGHSEVAVDHISMPAIRHTSESEHRHFCHITVNIPHLAFNNGSALLVCVHAQTNADGLFERICLKVVSGELEHSL